MPSPVLARNALLGGAWAALSLSAYLVRATHTPAQSGEARPSHEADGGHRPLTSMKREGKRKKRKKKKKLQKLFTCVDTLFLLDNQLTIQQPPLAAVSWSLPFLILVVFTEEPASRWSRFDSALGRADSRVS